MTANPLVSGPVDTSSPFAGLGVVESIADLCTALESGDWLAGTLAGVGAALDVTAAVMDPLGSLIAAGLGWLMENLEPLKGWLNDLTGDAAEVAGFAATWDNIAAAMAGAGDELEHSVRADLEGMAGASVAAYAAYADGLAARIRATAGSSTAMASALRTCGTVVQVVHDLVRDVLAELVGSIISWAAEAIFTLGLATPYIAAQVTSRVASISARVGRSVTDVVTSASALRNLLDALKAALRSLDDEVRDRLPGSRSHAPTTPSSPATPSTPVREAPDLPGGQGPGAPGAPGGGGPPVTPLPTSPTPTPSPLPGADVPPPGGRGGLSETPVTPPRDPDGADPTKNDPDGTDPDSTDPDGTSTDTDAATQEPGVYPEFAGRPGFREDGTIDPEAFRPDPGSSYFWSGMTSDGQRAEFLAPDIAGQHGGQTLEMLMRERGIELPRWSDEDPVAQRAWEEASAAFANGTSGDVRAVIGDNLRPGNIWENVELERLKANPDVTSITVINPATGVERQVYP